MTRFSHSHEHLLTHMKSPVKIKVFIELLWKVEKGEGQFHQQFYLKIISSHLKQSKHKGC